VTTTSSAATVCYRHPNVETLLSCTRCDRPACPDCLRAAAVGQQCVECLAPPDTARAKASPAAARVRSRHRQDTRPGWVFGVLCAAFAVLCVLATQVSAAEILDGTASKAVPILVVVVGWVLSLCLHEYAHAATAYRFGDRSVVEKGYLKLDPRRYADPFTSLLLPIVFLVAGGIGLPGGAVWIEQSRLTKRARTVVSLAGPATNVVFGAVILLILATGVVDEHATLAGALAVLALVEFATAILNLIPVPGLDGFGAIEPWLPAQVRARLTPGVRLVAMMALLVLLVSSTTFGNQIFEWALWGTDQFHLDRALLSLGYEIAWPDIL
jgi:Zn-dependent protease